MRERRLGYGRRKTDPCGGTASGCTSGCRSTAWKAWPNTKCWSTCSTLPTPAGTPTPPPTPCWSASGILRGCLQASEEELCLVEGVGPAAARFLHLLPQVSACYHRSLTKDRRRMQTVEQMGQYLMARFRGALQERVLLVCLDRQRRITCTAWLSSGDADSVQLPVKEAIAQAVRLKARWVVLCHNHPSGNALPSRQDIEATAELARGMFVVGGGSCWTTSSSPRRNISPCASAASCPRPATSGCTSSSCGRGRGKTLPPSEGEGRDCTKEIECGIIGRQTTTIDCKMRRKGGVSCPQKKTVSNWCRRTSPPATSPKPSKSWCRGSGGGDRCQTLLGVTGSGKTFTMANVIAQCNRPTLVLAHNKDPGRPAVHRVPGVFPGKCGGILRQLLRLLPARGLYPQHRHLH